MTIPTEQLSKLPMTHFELSMNDLMKKYGKRISFSSFKRFADMTIFCNQIEFSFVSNIYMLIEISTHKIQLEKQHHKSVTQNAPKSSKMLFGSPQKPSQVCCACAVAWVATGESEF
jgi:hypothetical protein